MKLNWLVLIGIIFFLISCNEQIDKKNFPIIRQEQPMQCGPICIQMIGKYYGRNLDIKQLEVDAKMGDDGTSLLGLSEAADIVGLNNLSVRISFEKLVEDMPLPAIVHWNQNHFVVVYHVTKSKVFVADPAGGKIEYSKKEFCESWIPKDTGFHKEGIVMLFETTTEFYKEIK